MAATISLEVLKGRLSEEFKPWVDEYGSAILKIIAQDLIVDWFNLVMRGDAFKAWAMVVKHMENAALFKEWEKLQEEIQDTNIENEARLKLQRMALYAGTGIMLKIFLAAVGL